MAAGSSSDGDQASLHSASAATPRRPAGSPGGSVATAPMSAATYGPFSPPPASAANGNGNGNGRHASSVHGSRLGYGSATSDPQRVATASEVAQRAPLVLNGGFPYAGGGSVANTSGQGAAAANPARPASPASVRGVLFPSIVPATPSRGLVAAAATPVVAQPAPSLRGGFYAGSVPGTPSQGAAAAATPKKKPPAVYDFN